MASLLGQVLDNYRIIEDIGSGGMGVVYKAIHTKLEKIVALKLISPSLAMNDVFIKRFKTEAKALAKLENPNIVSIYDLRSSNDRWFIIMEYVEGINLSDKIAHDGALSWKESIDILLQILSAIDHAHKANIIHRDLKPHNVMITDTGLVKITDFGLAKDQTVGSNTQTVTGGGTLYYMSPEHVKGFNYIDHRSDIYSIGMTFYEMITGTVPFENIDSDFDIREMIVRKEFTKPTDYVPDIPAELEAIVMKSITKNPKDRFQSISEMKQAVVKFEKQFSQEKSKKIIPEKDKKKQLVSEPVKKDKVEESTIKEAEDVFELNWFSQNIKYILSGVSVILLLLIFIFYSDIFSNEKDIPEKLLNKADLTVNTSPEQATVFLDNDSIGTTPLLQFAAQEGMHNLRIEKDNFTSIDTTIMLETNINLNIDFNLSSIKSTVVENKSIKKSTKISNEYASVLIRSNPKNANIFINNIKKGRTPKRLLNLRPGNYNIKLIKTGFEEYNQRIKLVAEKEYNVNAKLVHHSGNLRININQPDVKVSINNKTYSQSASPFELKKIPVGKHRVKILKAGYLNFIKDIVIERNKTVSFNATLARLTGELNVLVKPWGSIYINNELQKSSTDILFNTDLPVDKYNIKIEHPTFGIWQKFVEIKTGISTDINVNFNETILVNVNANDENGNSLSGDIYLDGKFTGKRTPQTLIVRTGIHKMYVKKDGYKSDKNEKNVLVDNNFKNPIVFKLSKN